MGARSITGFVTVGLMLAVLALAAGPGSQARRPPVLAPWRPSLAVRFSGAMRSFDHPVARSSDHNGVVTLMMTGVLPSDLVAIRSAAARSAERVVASCHCHLRGYEVLARLPGRGVQVVAADGARS
jgi:hypothetical protein